MCLADLKLLSFWVATLSLCRWFKIVVLVSQLLWLVLKVEVLIRLVACYYRSLLVERLRQILSFLLKVGLSWRWSWCCCGNTTCTSSTWQLLHGLWTPQRGRPGWRSQWRGAMTFCTTSAAPRGNPSPARTAPLSSDASGTRCKGPGPETLLMPPLCWIQPHDSLKRELTKIPCLLFQYQPNRPDVGAPSVLQFTSRELHDSWEYQKWSSSVLHPTWINNSGTVAAHHVEKLCLKLCQQQNCCV